MSGTRLLSDTLGMTSLPQQNSHPMDSSRVLLGLMALARKAVEDSPESHALEGVIAPGVLRSLLSALQYRDATTVRHARRVAMLAVGMARYLGWEGRDLKVLEISALLHDIGKIGVPDNILFKPGPLSADEAELMALHFNIGVDVLQACRVDPKVLENVGHAHSHYNGATEGFRIGNDVPMGARILSVADAYESLHTEQVYRKAKSHAEIMKTLMDHAGTQFDGNIVCALSRSAQEKGPPLGTQSAPEAEAAPAPTSGRADEAQEASTLCHIFSFLYLLESLYDGFYLVDSDLRFVIWNRGAEKLLGYTSPQMLSQVWTSRVLQYADRDGRPRADHECPMHQVVATGKPATFTLQVKHVDKSWKEVELQTVPLIDQGHRLQGVAEIFRDISRSSRKPQEYHDLRIAASRDPLTSVANRGELETQLAVLLADHSQHKSEEPFGLIFLDVDHFKAINDRYGHTVGDQVLVETARLLQHETYSGELVGRYGGEEFVILCPATDLDQAHKRAERLRHAVARMKIESMHGAQVTASFGVTQGEPGDSVESILRRADQAMYAAKEGGRNQTRVLGHADSAAVAAPGDAPPTESSPFLYQSRFYAFVAADMIAYKLGGYVNDHQAKLLKVSPKFAAFRLGNSGMFLFWGKTDDRKPVEVELQIGEPEPPMPGRRARNLRVEVVVKIRPNGWVRSQKTFENRAKRVLKELTAYFAAEAK